jgi:hypothetical protein
MQLNHCDLDSLSIANLSGTATAMTRRVLRQDRQAQRQVRTMTHFITRVSLAALALVWACIVMHST